MNPQYNYDNFKSDFDKHYLSSCSDQIYEIDKTDLIIYFKQNKMACSKYIYETYGFSLKLDKIVEKFYTENLSISELKLLILMFSKMNKIPSYLIRSYYINKFKLNMCNDSEFMRILNFTIMDKLYYKIEKLKDGKVSLKITLGELIILNYKFGVISIAKTTKAKKVVGNMFYNKKLFAEFISSVLNNVDFRLEFPYISKNGMHSLCYERGSIHNGEDPPVLEVTYLNRQYIVECLYEISKMLDKFNIIDLNLNSDICGITEETIFKIIA